VARGSSGVGATTSGEGLGFIGGGPMGPGRMALESFGGGIGGGGSMAPLDIRPSACCDCE
jgi:hypothetical protein